MFWKRIKKSEGTPLPIPSTKPGSSETEDKESTILQKAIDDGELEALVSVEPNPKFYKNYLVFDGSSQLRGQVTLDGPATTQRQHNFERLFGFSLTEVNGHPPLPSNYVYIFQLYPGIDGAADSLSIWFGPGAHDIFRDYVIGQSMSDGSMRIANQIYPPE